MDKVYNPKKFEGQIYQFWEKGSYFTPKIEKEKKPFIIILPPPNANAPLHMGHALYVVEDILCRYHRMKGEPTLFLPGTDHAGIETQYVFEKKLKDQGQSRFNFDRETLYQLIWNFVEENRGIAKKQMKELGFSLDWSRERYTLDPKILKTVLGTFEKLHQDGLVYRGQRIVNYCTFCGTAFSELEVNHLEKEEFLYFLDYGPVQIATTRPETIFADTAVAINPQEKKYQKLVGQKAIVPLINKEVPIIADELVQLDFGTGALKITPAHDVLDFEIGQKHKLAATSCISLEGKMINVPPQLADLFPKQAREKTLELLKKEGKLVKVEPLRHVVGHCYKCKNPIEPLLMPQWFVKIAPLAKPAIEAVNKNKVKIFPARFKKIYLNWMANIRDWNISRQIVWGPRIPAWYCLDCNPKIKINFLDKDQKLISGPYEDLKSKYPFEEIKKGLQSLNAPVEATYLTEKPINCPVCQGKNFLQETDTFDTWFSSGQWPLTTLGFPGSPDFKYFYPTSILDTMWDILFFWVARMIMLGLYRTKEVPFRVAHMHSRVVDVERKKMSKSKGNVIDPIEMVNQFGADALRMALVFGTAPASDLVVTEEKIKAMRNFANKLWNIGRFLLSKLEENPQVPFYSEKLTGLKPEDKKIVQESEKTIQEVETAIKRYHFGIASEKIYDFIWHRLADQYLEESKERIKNQDLVVLAVIRHVYLNCLKLLHPFMPFVTEAVWQKIPKQTNQALIISSWPTNEEKI